RRNPIWQSFQEIRGVEVPLQHHLHSCSELRIASALAVQKGCALWPGWPEQRRLKKIVLGVGILWHRISSFSVIRARPGLHQTLHPLPARNEWGEERGEGKSIKTPS